VLQLRAGDDRSPGALVGAVIFERFDAVADGDGFRELVSAVARHGGRALANARMHEDIPFLPILRLLGRLGWLTRVRNWPKLFLAGIAVAGVGAALALVPADFHVEGPGELQPVRRRDVFAPADGIVDDLRVDQGSEVDPAKAGQDTLAVLRRPELEFEATRVAGELLTTQKRLAAIETARLDPARIQGDAPEQYNDLTAEEEELKEQLASLRRQADVLERQQSDLTVRPPIAGQVITWDLRKQLEARPVEQGQKLMTVADLDGPWIVELRLPDHLLGHLHEVARRAEEPLPASFLVKTDPGTTHAGTVEKVALASETDAQGTRSVLVTIAIDGDRIPGQRPGASVLARVHCGRRPIGYVWFHEIWETIQSRWLF
jgi:hypothetical protein